MKSNLGTKILLPFALIAFIGLGCKTSPKTLSKPIKSTEPLSREELLLNLGIPSRFHDYRKKFLKIPCHSKTIDIYMNDMPFHLHRYLIPGEDNIPDVVEYYPVKGGVKSENPEIYVFDMNGDKKIQARKEVYFDPYMDGLNGNEFLLPENDKLRV